MLTGNKLYDFSLSAAKVSGEKNYTPATTSYGSSYTPLRSSLLSSLPTPSSSTIQPLDPYTYMDVPANNPYKTIANYQKSLTSVGQEVPQRSGSGLGNVLMTALDLMQRPQYMVTNVLQEITDDKKSTPLDVAKASLQGLTGERKSSTTDIFDNLNWKNNDDYTWYGKSKSGDGTWNFGNTLRNTLGLAGDIVLDPTTWASAGTSKVSQLLGTKAVGAGSKNTIIDVMTKAIPDIMKTPFDESIDSVYRFMSQGGKNVVDVAKNLDAAVSALPEVQRDFVIKLADAIGKTTDLSKAQHVAQNQGLVNRLLTKGLDGINSDTVLDILNPLKQTKLAAEEIAKVGTEAFNRSSGQIIGKKLQGVFKLTKDTLDMGMDAATDLAKRKSDFYTEVIEVITKPSVPLSLKDKATKLEALRTLYKGEGVLEDILPNVADLADKELETIRVLLQNYGGFADIGETLAKDLKGTLTNLDVLTKNAKPMAKIEKVSTAYRQTLGSLRRIEDGIEFSNGLQRVLDTATKSFSLRYHNPFTGTIKPLLELTDVVKSDVARKAWDMVVSGDYLSTALKPVAKALGRTAHVVSTGVMNSFMTEGISKTIAKLPNGAYDPVLYEGSKSFARMVTEFLRMENALPRRAMEALKMFMTVEGFYDNAAMRQAATLNIIRSRSALAEAAWRFVSGEAVTSSTPKEVIDAFAKIQGSEHLLRKLTEIKQGITPDMMNKFTAAAEKNTLFNEIISKFDAERNIIFRDSIGADRANIVEKSLNEFKDAMDSGLLDPASYVRQYHDTAAGAINPLAPESSKAKLAKRQGANLDDPTSSVVLGRASDPLRSRTSGNTGSFMKRKYPSHIEAMLYNPDSVIDLDLASNVARRTLDSERVALNKEFVRSVEDYIQNVPGFSRLISDKQIAGFEKVPLMDGAITYYAHPEIANQVRRVTEVFSPNSQAQNEVFAIIQEVSNGLKSLQTKWNPSFNLRNFIGEPLMTFFMGGVEPSSGKIARDIMNASKMDSLFKVGDTTLAKTGGDITPLFREYMSKPTSAGMEALDPKVISPVRTLELADGAGTFYGGNVDIDAIRMDATQKAGVVSQIYNINGKEYTPQDIMAEFYNVGLGWSGVTKGNLAKNIQGMLEQEMFTVTGGQRGMMGALKTVNEKVGNPSDFIETWSRLSHYIDARMKGMSISEAALEVRKYHVDYKDLTRFERSKLRTLLPYYTYMRKNLPMQVNLMLERQNLVNMVGQLVDSSYEALQRDNDGRELVVPDYLKEGLAIPLFVDEEGKVTYLNWGIPIADVGRLKYNMDEFLKENFFSMLTPMVKTPLELSMNKTMLYDSYIKRYEGERVDLIPGSDKFPKISPELDQILQNLGILNTIRGGIGVGAQEGIMAGLGKTLTGSILPTKDQQQVANQQAYDYRDQLYGYIQSLRDQGTYVPPYSPPKKGEPIPLPMQQTENQGYLGVSNRQLYYPPAQRLLQALLGRMP